MPHNNSAARKVRPGRSAFALNRAGIRRSRELGRELTIADLLTVLQDGPDYPFRDTSTVNLFEADLDAWKPIMELAKTRAEEAGRERYEASDVADLLGVEAPVWTSLLKVERISIPEATIRALALDELDELEAQVLVMTYGLAGGRPLRFSEAAAHFGISREAARAITVSAMETFPGLLMRRVAREANENLSAGEESS